MSEHHGKIWWSELICDDPAAAIAYYQKTAGWTFSEMPSPDGSPYHIASLADQPVAGIMKRPADMPAEAPPTWMTYVAVSDVDAAAKAAPQLLNGPFDVPGVGRIAMVIDGGGAVVGLMTPAD